jgi:hypothetical protein
VGFAMDGVRSVRNLGRQFQLTTVPDPQLAPFKGVQTLALGQPLAIEGKQLELAAISSEYNVIQFFLRYIYLGHDWNCCVSHNSA